MSHELSHDAEARRYSLALNGDVASSADYVIQGDSILFTHTVTAPSHRGEGLADKLVTFAVNDVEANSTLRIVPRCSYVVEWFHSHPERAGLLTRHGGSESS